MIKNLESRLNILLIHLKKILRFLILPLILRIFTNITKLFMKLIWPIIFQCILKNLKRNFLSICKMQLSKGNKHSAKEYAEAIDFMKRSYESYQEVFEDYHGVLSPF